MDPSFEDTDFTNDEVINTEYFDIPLPPASANVATTFDSTFYQDVDPDTVITDLLQYLSNES
jgi:hypothetical protein